MEGNKVTRKPLERLDRQENCTRMFDFGGLNGRRKSVVEDI